MSLSGAPLVPLAVHQLRVSYAVVQPLRLPAYRGPALRGAMIEAVRARFCLLQGSKEARPCGQEPGCPVCGLVATVDPGNTRGMEVPRPYALRPLNDSHTVLTVGDTLQFEIMLFGSAIRFIPYLTVALGDMRRIGAGHDEEGGRQLVLCDIWAVNELLGESHRVSGARQARIVLPRLPMVAEQIAAVANNLQADAVTLQLRTPMRLIHNGQLVHRLDFPALIRRVVRRVIDLCAAYGTSSFDDDLTALLAGAIDVQVRRDDTRWLDLMSGSSRAQRTSPIGGLIGTISFQGTLDPFLPWLLWGELVQVGKDTTKGNGHYQVIPG